MSVHVHIHVYSMVCVYLLISSVVVLEEVVGTPGHTYFTAHDRSAK